MEGDRRHTREGMEKRGENKYIFGKMCIFMLKIITLLKNLRKGGRFVMKPQTNLSACAIKPFPKPGKEKTSVY